MQLGKTNSYIQKITNIDLWFIEKLRNIFNFEQSFLKDKELYSLDKDLMLRAKQLGFSDQQIAKLTFSDFFDVRKYRKNLNIIPIYKTVDTCSAEFSSSTPYHYSTYEEAFIKEVTNIDLWFIEKLRNIFNFENDFLKEKELYDLDRDLMLHSKQLGFSDQQIAKLTNSEFFEVRRYRKI